MSKSISILFLLCLLFSLAFSQSTVTYRLSSQKMQIPDGKMEWDFFYTPEGNIAKLVHKQDGVVFYTETDFITDNENRVTGFSRVFANGKTKTEHHRFEYYGNGKLWKHIANTDVKKLAGGTSFQSGKVYKWYDDSVVIYKGNLINEEFYSKEVFLLNKKGNITERRSLYINNNSMNSPAVYSAYDKFPNPLTMRGNYIDGEIISTNNYLQQSGQGSGLPGKIACQYNKEGLLTATTTTYDNTAYKILHTTTFSYTKISLTGMDEIFKLARSLQAKSIQKYVYKGADLYEINNSFYTADCLFVFKRISKSGASAVYGPSINTTQLKITLGRWILNANGQYIPLR